MGTEIEIFKATSMAAAAAAAGGFGATSFCRADSAFLCGRNTNTSNNSNSKLRVLMCEVCEQAPAAVTCKADAAALCVACDLDIHSANPVAYRHERVPIEPFVVDSVSGEVGNRAYSSSGFGVMVPAGNEGGGGGCEYDHEADGVSWMLPGGIVGGAGGGLIPQLDQKIGEQGKCSGNGFFGEMDSLLEFEYGDLLEGRFQQSYSCGSDGVVPVQNKPLSLPLQPPASGMGHQILLTGGENGMEFDFCRSKLSPFSYPTQSSLSNSVSSSSHDVGIVPDGSSNSMSEISFSFDHPNVPISSALSTANPANPHHHHQAPPQQLCGVDREARVMRYREKRKNRKFEKTIRYASRKAYAETRPRIKGRFAKRSGNNLEQQDFESCFYGSAASLSFLGNIESRFDLVPSFR